MKSFRSLITIIVIIFTSCQDGKLAETLKETDELLSDKKYDQADSLLASIDIRNNAKDADYAYYCLLKTQVDCHFKRSIFTLSSLNQAVSTFEYNRDYNKLLRAYYYLGIISYNQDDRIHAVYYLKKGELIAKTKQINNSWVHLIYQGLSVVNGYSGEYEKCIYYGRKALDMAVVANDFENIACDIMNLSAAYGENGMLDSSLFYTNKLIMFAETLSKQKNISPTLLGSMYSNIGIDYYHINKEKAKSFLLKSIQYANILYSYKTLGQIYADQGDVDSAEEMWSHALMTNDYDLKINVIKLKANLRAKQGRYKEANELNAQALALKDSLLAQQRGEDLRGRQEQIEQSASLEELVRENRYWIVVAGLLMVLLIAFSFYYSKRKRRAKQLQQQLLEEIEQKRMELENVRISEENASDQVGKLTRELKTLEKRYTERIQTGEQLYDELLAGGNTVQWSKHDYDVFIQYSKLKNTKLVKQIETDYAPLSPRYMTCAILHHMGKSDEEIKQALAVSDSSLRSIKTRIKAKKKIVNAASA